MLDIKNIESQKKENTRKIEERRIKIFLGWITGFSGILSISNLVLAIYTGEESVYLLSGLFALSAIVGALSLSRVWSTSNSFKLFTSAILIDLALTVSAAVFSFFYGFPIAFIVIFLGFLYAAFNHEGVFNNWIVSFGLLAALIGLTLRVLSPFPQFSNLIINGITSVFLVLVIVIFVRMALTGQILFSLRIKLTALALAISLIPLIVISVITSRSTSSSIQTQSNESLKIATRLSIDEIDSYLSSTLNTMQTVSSLPAIRTYLKYDEVARMNSPEEDNLQATLDSLQTTETTYIPDYGVLNQYGYNIFDTDTTRINLSERNEDYFQQASQTGSTYISSVVFPSDTRESYIYFITPILDTDRSILGYLRMEVDARILQSKVVEMAGIIGAHSYPILLDENGLRLADSMNPNLIYHTIRSIDENTYNTLLKDELVPSYISFSEIAADIPDVSNALYEENLSPYDFFTVNLEQGASGEYDSATYSTLSNQNWTIVFLQEQTAVVAAQESLSRSTTLIGILIAAVVSLVVTIFSSVFTKPIVDLTSTAVKIASGDFSIVSKVTTNDEVGLLGNAFNSMTAQLRESISTLESRVNERTQQLAEQYDTLEYRSRQLQTVSDVARQLVSTTDFESLLNSITTLISDRFNYYHVGIFLIDEMDEFAVLRASNSPGGQRMLDRQHKLKVGQVGIVGYVTGSGLPRIATDVGKDAVFFNNPDLPETKSEMALPLKIEDKVIGALDIQSTESNAFSESDINLFSTLADQASIAINNNQLLSRTEKALAEAQSLHRQYLEQEWTQRSAEEGQVSYRYTPKGLIVAEENLPEIRMVFDSNRPVTRTYSSNDGDQEPYSVLAVPILLRGQAIGVIHLRQNGEQDFVWSENELITVQNVADQVAQTLESARLFEQTVRRADRERRVLEVTNRIRSTNDPQKMLEVTLEELRKHLGASQTQIVINVPGVTSSLTNPNPPPASNTNTNEPER